jgi:antibiotic biosynthesis monooxygenase (ABM) superfamily enzyme
MAKVMFTISYAIKPEHRSNYLSMIGELKSRLATLGKNYAVYETKGKRNQFNEVYLFTNEEEYDALDDNQDEQTQELLSKLESCVDNGGMKYTTTMEVQ